MIVSSAPPSTVATATSSSRIMITPRHALEFFLQTIQIYVQHWREKQGHELRKDEATNDGQTERTARGGTNAERDGQRCEKRREGGHHDGPKANHAAFIDRVESALALVFGSDRKIDLHDRVLLHDANQENQADEGIHVQLDVENQQRE